MSQSITLTLRGYPTPWRLKWGGRSPHISTLLTVQTYDTRVLRVRGKGPMFEFEIPHIHTFRIE